MFFNSALSLSNLSGTTSTQAETQAQSCSGENNESPNLQEQEEKEEQADSGVCDGEVGFEKTTAKH